ncbi:electron transfer flavoprotein subunit beta/FixA family protein [bacterium]|nr:electron transfer flavoprotein subunit beta/FixA family protein [bacterium]
MNIAVCLKQVPDTEARLRIREGAVDLTDVKMVVGPFDEFAVEEAVRIKEKAGSGEITIFCIGPEKAKEAIKWAFSIGADQGYLLKDQAFEHSDLLGTARILAKALQKGSYDLILCGKQSVDDDAGQVGPALAEILDLPHVTTVHKLELASDGKSALCYRDFEGGVEVVETTLPAVITAEKGLNEVRYASLKGIMAAKKKKLEELDLAALGLAPTDVGQNAALLVIKELQMPPVRAAGKIVEGGSAQEKVANLIKMLHDEAKVI